jgi:hypothetical protein
VGSGGASVEDGGVEVRAAILIFALFQLATIILF